MPIHVTLSGILNEDLWGADEAFKAGGATAVRELAEEDLTALLESLDWKIEQVDDALDHAFRLKRD